MQFSGMGSKHVSENNKFFVAIFYNNNIYIYEIIKIRSCFISFVTLSYPRFDTLEHRGTVELVRSRGLFLREKKRFSKNKRIGEI